VAIVDAMQELDRQRVTLQRLVRLLALVCSVCAASRGAAQDARGGQIPTLQVTSNLVLLDVYSTDVASLSRAEKDDFELRIDGHRTSVGTFAQGSKGEARPIQLWFLLQCPMQGWGNEGSGFFTGKTLLLRPALDVLPPGTTVGVAHWCDDGVSLVDARPTVDMEQVMTSLDDALKPVTRGLTSREGELALQATLKLIDSYARRSSPAKLPIVVAIHGDKTAAPTREVERLLGDVVSSSVTVFLLTNDGAGDESEAPTGPRHARPIPAQQTWQILHRLASMSGGTVFPVDHDRYADVLERITAIAGARVELGFRPPVVDSRWHTIDVRWRTSRAARSHAKLTYKSQYFAGQKPY